MSLGCYNKCKFVFMLFAVLLRKEREIMSLSANAPWRAFYGSTPETIDYPQTTMYQQVSAAAKEYPNNNAYIFMGKETTYRVFLQRIEAAAKGLYAMGIRKGDKVTVSVEGPSEVELFDVLCDHFTTAM